MNKRQEKIIAAVIEEYTNTAVPVGSEIVVKKYIHGVSPATVRNDMNVLEEEGFLYQPHVSAGRIPTDKGYRFFVEEVMKDRELSLEDQKKMQADILKLRAQNMRLMRTTAKLLSSYSGGLAISSLEKEFSDFGVRGLLANPEFQEIDEFCKVAEVLDYIDENVDTIFKQIKDGETKIFIGNENPIKQISNCSMVVSPYKNKKGERGLLAIIGPKRMKYAKNKSLLEYMRKLLSSAAVLVIVINIF
ncbi:hypothetical protein EPO05_02330 [Patescibacteria group bacterium]|nr:MAG: hypothetical protein EPO05_02330 [Patescibacteria group bacterium]